ncbi:MAG TPA: PH domain-containing protein [Acidimicrobiales bacterium]|nr:PH domain-containing protein [Acidimicrobiales bacterium]
MSESVPRPDAEYRQSLPKLLTVNILLCFIIVGFYTLPVALLRRSKTKLVLTPRTVSYTTGVLTVTTSDLPLLWVTNVNTEQGMWDRTFGCGTLVIASNNGQTARYKDLENVEGARAELQARVAAQTS